MSLQLRSIQESDNPVIANIVQDAMAPFNVNPEGTILSDPTLHSMFACYQEKNAIYLVAEWNGEIVGGCGIRQLNGTEENICELQRMFVSPGFQGKGIGTALMEACLEKAKQFGYSKVYLETLSEMGTAIRLYERHGFSVTPFRLGNTGHGGCNKTMILDLSVSL